MKIEEFSVTSYGASPLYFPKPQKPAAFNLFYGPNEAGKSLLIDALLKLMLGKKAAYSPPGTSDPVFENLDRVEVEPEGFVRVKIGDESYKFPEQGSLVEILNESASGGSELQQSAPPDFRNIFVVRDSNLKFTGTMGSDYYSDLQDKLTGLHSKQIKNIRKKLQEKGRLTNSHSDASLSSRQDNNQLGDRFDRAGELLKEVSKLKTEAKDENYYQLEEKLQETKWKIGKLEEEIGLLHRAKKRDNYERGQQLLKDYEETKKEIKNYENITDDDFEKYRKAKERIEQLKKDKKKEQKNIEKQEQEIKELEEPLARIEREKNRLEEQVKVINQKVHSLLKEAEKFKEKLARSRPTEKYLNRIIGFWALGTVILLPLIYFRITAYDWLYPLFFLLGLAGSSLWKGKIIRERNQYRVLIQKIKNILSGFGIEKKDLPGLKQEIQELKQQLNEKEDQLEQLKDRQSSLAGQKESTEESLGKILEELAEKKEIIARINKKAGVQNFGEYENKHREKNKLKNNKNGIKSELQGKFGKKDEQFSLEQIKDELSQLAPYKDAAGELEFEEEKLKQWESEKEKLEKDSSRLAGEYERLEDRLAEIEKEVSEILAPEAVETPVCQDLNDLEEIETKLQKFRENVNLNMEAALTAIEIFEELETEEEQQVKELFDPENKVNDYFRQITGGRYKSIEYQPEEKRLIVTDQNENRLTPEKLSGGTFDQLYFSIRLGLGNRLLEASPGFFILDDPFIKADSKRLKRQIEMLKKITDAGWQVLYFSAKNEVRETVGTVFKDFREIKL